MTAFTLSEHDRADFERWGVLLLPGLLDSGRVAAARDVVRRRLETGGMMREGEWTLDHAERPRWPASGLKTRKVVGNQHRELEALTEDPSLAAAVAALTDCKALDRSIYRRPQMLVTLPNADVWRLPSRWHTDAPRIPSGESCGVQFFTCLEPTRPGGGATLAVAGSHRLLNEGRAIKAKEMRKLLSGEPFFAHLWEDGGDRTTLPSGAVGDFPLSVVEMCGEPGDAWLMDLRTLHAAAPNASDRPRVMLTNRFVMADRVGDFASAYGWGEKEEV